MSHVKNNINEADDDWMPPEEPTTCDNCGAGLAPLHAPYTSPGTKGYEYLCDDCLETARMRDADEMPRFDEGVSFDKYMDSIMIAEGRLTKKRTGPEEVSPSRQHAAKYRERPLNRTRVGGRGSK